jgi:hypothetical protein
MPTSDAAYRRAANRCAELAVACSAPSIATALLALSLDYMALADRLGRPAVPQEGQHLEEMQEVTGFGD